MITITTPNTAKITFKGTDVEINNIVCRVQAFLPPDGKSIETAFQMYSSVSDYQNGSNELDLSGVDGFSPNSRKFDIPDGSGGFLPQTMSLAHDKLKAYLDGLGYLATISL